MPEFPKMSVVGIDLWCSTSKGVVLQVKSILTFVFDVLELFLSFTITPHLLKWSKVFKFYNWKQIEHFYYSLDFFWMFSSIDRNTHNRKAPFLCTSHCEIFAMVFHIKLIQIELWKGQMAWMGGSIRGSLYLSNYNHIAYLSAAITSRVLTETKSETNLIVPTRGHMSSPNIQSW